MLSYFKNFTNIQMSKMDAIARITHIHLKVKLEYLAVVRTFN